MAEWISVKDRLPDNGTKVLMYFDYGAMEVSWYDSRYYQPFWDRVTHWMPFVNATMWMEIDKKELIDAMTAWRNRDKPEAHWLRSKRDGIFMCSKCCIEEIPKTVMGKPDWKFCPNCGKRMFTPEDYEEAMKDAYNCSADIP